MPLLSLYPAIRPYHQFSLSVDDIHTLHVEECGNRQGLPVVFLHGGPGAGCEPYHRQFFDPERYRIVLFDQRGAGRSKPHAEIQANTLQHLVSDIELIRERLQIRRWVVFGGSWGTTLALAYAEAHPERVIGLILRGVFLCRDRDIRWFYQEGASRLFPDYWRDFLAPIPPPERDDLLRAYHERLCGRDEVSRMAAAKAWSLWEGCTATLQSNPKVIEHFSDPYVALSLARIESHYFVNHAYLRPNQLLEEAFRLNGIPGVIVHGRYDVICPLEQALALHEAWPQAELNIIADAGHAATEPGITDALLRATRNMVELRR